MPNHLLSETSPYLLQHASNPVNWYPWGEEALAEARSGNKPIFLSIGYAACHWCHVMAHESFEDPRVADLLNTNFVCVKVDREERPDIDDIYMQAAVAMAGSGGWPLSVFLTPELKPFFAGTYFPPSPRHGLPAFGTVLESIARAWQNERAQIEAAGQRAAQALYSSASAPRPSAAISPVDVSHAAQALVATYDWTSGGWGEPPKFPHAMSLDFLLVRAATHAPEKESVLKLVRHCLDAMSRGGMYDVLGGGFSRYSTDALWHIPHFEKMLYDNALLGRAYLHAWQLTGEPEYRRILIETLDFLTRELLHSDGGFFCSIDADSSEGEGVFYAWEEEEIRLVLGADASLFGAAYGVGADGNWEGRNILRRAADEARLAAEFHLDAAEVSTILAKCRARLLAARSARERPSTDDKVLTSWNGLALALFAEAARIPALGSVTDFYQRTATRNADFLLRGMRPGGQLRHSWRDGTAAEHVFLEDYGALILGLLELYQTDFNPRWFSAAVELAQEMIKSFHTPEHGFHDTPAKAQDLIVRPRNLQDNATPSGAALACEALQRIAALADRPDYAALAEVELGRVLPMARVYPNSFARWLTAGGFQSAEVRQVALIGSRADPDFLQLRETLRSEFRPHVVAAASSLPVSESSPALLRARPAVGGKATAYVCQGFTCKMPVTDPASLATQLS